MANPVLNLEFDLTKGEFKPLCLDEVKDLPFDKLYFAFELIQQWLMGQHIQKAMQAAQSQQARKIVMPGPQVGNNIFSP